MQVLANSLQQSKDYKKNSFTIINHYFNNLDYFGFVNPLNMTSVESIGGPVRCGIFGQMAPCLSSIDTLLNNVIT